MILALENLIPKWRPNMRNTVPVPHVSSKIIRPLDSPSPNSCAPFNRTIHTVVEMHCAIVSVEGLLCLEDS